MVRAGLRPHRAAPILGWLLVWAMLLAQTLALVHGAVHGMHAPSRAESPEALLHGAVEVAPGADEADWAHRLFPDHHSGADCRLYDQAGHADTLPGVPMLVLPLLLSSHALHVFSGLALARWAALFQARGPPFFR